MTNHTLQQVAKILTPGDHVRLLYKAAPFGPGPTGLVPNVIGGAYVGLVGDALAYDDISGDGQCLRAYVDAEDIATVIVVGKVSTTPVRLS